MGILTRRIRQPSYTMGLLRVVGIRHLGSFSVLLYDKAVHLGVIILRVEEDFRNRNGEFIRETFLMGTDKFLKLHGRC